MKKFNSSTYGFYLPSFFFLSINTQESLADLEALSEESKSTLYHEYIHFLQDITTLFGLGSISQVVDTQKMINHEILQSSKPTFLVPVAVDADGPTGINMELLNLYGGDWEHDVIGIRSIEKVEKIPNGFVLGFEQVPSIIVSYIDILGKPGQFNFGAVCVSESLANLIQESMFDDVDAPCFPYQIAKKVCEFLCPALANDIINVIVLCDIALNNSHPGAFFVDFLTKMEEDSYVPSTYKDIYRRFEAYRLTDINGVSLPVLGFYNQYAEQAKSQLKDYFTIPGFNEIKNWIEQIIDTGTNFRNNNFSFWLDILDAPTKKERRNNFIALTMVFGFPLMTNERQGYYFSHPNILTNEILSLRAIQEVNQLLLFGQKGCTMREFCSRPKNRDITSELCDEPWKRVALPMLCPFAKIWKMWGLSDKSPIFEPPTDQI